jgi:hypothetical protein
MKRIALLTALAVLAGCSENYWMTQSLKDAVTATQTVVKEKIAKGQMTEAEGKMIMAQQRAQFETDATNAAMPYLMMTRPVTYQQVGPGTVIKY